MVNFVITNPDKPLRVTSIGYEGKPPQREITLRKKPLNEQGSMGMIIVQSDLSMAHHWRFTEETKGTV